MAKNVGPFKFRGMLDDMMFRITEDGNIVGRKSGPSREKVLTHANFDRTRRNASEFKMAIGDAARLRYALSGALKKTGGSSLNGRMNGLFNIMLQDDPVNDLGSRRACNGNVSLLNGFDLNKHLSLSTVKLPFMHSLDASTGECRLNISPFIARKKKVYPKEATHFRIVSGSVSVNFIDTRRKGNTRDIKRSDLLPLSKKTPGNIAFEHRVQVQESEMLVQVLGIEFYKLVKDKEVLVKGGLMQVLEAVAVRSTEFRVESTEFRVESTEFRPGGQGVEKDKSSRTEDEVCKSAVLPIREDKNDGQVKLGVERLEFRAERSALGIECAALSIMRLEVHRDVLMKRNRVMRRWKGRRGRTLERGLVSG